MATIDVAALPHPTQAVPESFNMRSSASSDSSNGGLADEKRQAALNSLFRPQRRRKHKDSDEFSLDSLDPLDRASQTSRLRTFRTSFRYLRNLTPQQVNDYMASYEIYNLDWDDKKAMRAALGPSYQSRIDSALEAYYHVINHLCALGSVEKMYIPPLMDKRASVLENQLLYERAITRAIGLKAGDRVLDLGCGRGRVAAHMATAIPGVKVTGINVDPNQVGQAREFTAERGLLNEFIVKSFNQLPLPFANDQFDALYQIQALSLCEDLPGLFKEIYRIVKPGARISLLDWVSLPAYDPTNAEHVELMRQVKPLIGAVGTPTPASLEQAVESAGFVVVKSENASVGGLQAPLIDKVDVYFRGMRQMILALVKFRLLPPHFKTLIDRLCLDGQAFVKMDKMRLITTSYWVVAEKPLQ
jgi:sterol 24-C-methyltransferase